MCVFFCRRYCQRVFPSVPASVDWEFLFLHTLADTLYFLFFFYCSYSRGYQLITFYGFTLHILKLCYWVNTGLDYVFILVDWPIYHCEMSLFLRKLLAFKYNFSDIVMAVPAFFWLMLIGILYPCTFTLSMSLYVWYIVGFCIIHSFPCFI